MFLNCILTGVVRFRLLVSHCSSPHWRAEETTEEASLMLEGGGGGGGGGGDIIITSGGDIIKYAQLSCTYS